MLIFSFQTTQQNLGFLHVETSTVVLLTFKSDNVAPWLVNSLLANFIDWVEASLGKSLNYWIFKKPTCFTFKEYENVDLRERFGKQAQ